LEYNSDYVEAGVLGKKTGTFSETLFHLLLIGGERSVVRSLNITSIEH
jgi:hypothetical protein